jgi:hypothetical protein
MLCLPHKGGFNAFPINVAIAMGPWAYQEVLRRSATTFGLELPRRLVRARIVEVSRHLRHKCIKRKDNYMRDL